MTNPTRTQAPHMPNSPAYVSPLLSRRIAIAGLVAFLSACATPTVPPSDQHLAPAPAVQGKAPEFSVAPQLPKPPKPTEKPELYSVVVHDMNVQDLLFALARDAKLNVSVHPGISGNVTMSMLDQTLIEILDAVGKQVDLRYELKGKSLTISPDLPFLKMYRVDYPNMARSAESSVSISTNVASTGGTGGGGAGSNASDTTIKNVANNLFWETIVTNLKDILRETDKLVTDPATAAPAAAAAVAPAPVPVAAPVAATAPAASATSGARTGSAASPAAAAVPVIASAPVGASSAPVAPLFRETASVIANPENGMINIRATQRQHEKVREFLDGIMENARRQVLIEATIVEVDLSDRYQQGIDWSLVYRAAGDPDGRGIGMAPLGSGGGLLTGGVLSAITGLAYNRTVGNTTLTSAIRLLESFGTLRVLSSPKVSVLNSQTSILKVVDNEVYFTITVTPGTPAVPGVSAATPATYTSTINTVPIGFLMTVTPQISSSGEVILNLRPTISRISRYATDPNPDLRTNSIINQIPIVQSREMESILRVQSGDIAVLGGLIQDTRDDKSDNLPGVSGNSYLSNIFGYKDNRGRKTELVIFLRPVVLTDASLNGDFEAYRSILPEARSAFARPAESTPFSASRP